MLLLHCKYTIIFSLLIFLAIILNYFRTNLKRLRKAKGFTQDDLSKKIGVSRPKIGSYEEGRAEPKFETLQNIAHFFQVSIDELLQKDLSESDKHTSQKIDGSNLRILPIVVDSNNEELIPLVPIKASAGYLNSYDDIEFIEKLPNFNLPIKELSQGTFRAFQIKGDSMLPVQPDSYVLTEYVENWNWIKSGECYVVVSKNEGIIYKRIVNDLEENKELQLVSDNKSYNSYLIHVNDIVEIWKAKGYLTFDLPDEQKAATSVDDLSDMMLKLQEEVEKLKNNN